MTQHTAGPWRAEKHVTGNYQILAPNQNGDGLSELIAFDIEGEPNARLIAKAPEQEAVIAELLEALKECEIYVATASGDQFYFDETEKTLKQLRAAIAKATT